MKFVVVRSSAGSGKTYTLVFHYLRMMLLSDDPMYYRHILAITFTNKATNEMKERVLHALSEISAGNKKNAGLTHELSVETGKTEEEIKNKTAVILSNILHDYAEFSVSTIDRFVYKIIRSFAFELNLPGNLEIELDRERILNRSIDGLFQNLSEKSELLQLLIEFSETKFFNEKSIHPEEELKEIAREVIKTNTEPYLKELQQLRQKTFSKIRKNIHNRIQKTEEEIILRAKGIMSFLEGLGLESSDLAGGKNGIFNFADHYCYPGFDMKRPSVSLMKAIDGGQWKSSKVKGPKAAVIESSSAEIGKRTVDFLDFLNKVWNHHHFCLIMKNRLHLMALVDEINSEISGFKQSNEIAELDDFNHLISKLIDENPVPYIYERIGEKYHHYLIDEFQDTSRIQWYNLIPLIENGLSENHESMIVGDVKQAIYRWRGGDLTQMSRLPDFNFPGKDSGEIQFRQEVFGNQFNLKHLTSNFRSAPAIVKFVNKYFGLLTESFPENLAEIYSGHIQKVELTEVEGSVEIKFLEAKHEKEHRFLEILNAIHRFSQAGYAYADMAILCRKKDQCTEVTNYLIKNGIPVVSSESLKLSQSDDVRFLLNWLHFLFEGKSENFLFEILQYLVERKFIPSVDNDAFILIWKSAKDKNSLLTQFFPDFSINSILSGSLQEMTTNLAYRFMGENASNIFVVSFVNNLSGFESKRGYNVSEFFTWWDEKGLKLDVEMPGISESVNVMTIHKAKGLEFKIVLLPYVQDLIKASEDHFWVQTKGEDSEIMPIAWLPASESLMDTNYGDLYTAEMEKSFIDAINLLYVAMTRAAHHLFVISLNNSKKENKYREENLLWKCFQLNDYQGSEEAGTFKTGKLEVSAPRISEEEMTVKYSDLEDINWKKRIRLKYRIDKSDLSDAALTASEYGNLIHEILSEIENLTDLPAVVGQYVLRGWITEALSAEITNYIHQTLSKPEIQKYFANVSGKVFNEREILSDKGEIFRPDRMVLEEKKIVLIDYKTGKPDEKHRDQVTTYIKVLGQMMDMEMEGYLIYLTTGEVKKVA